MSGSLRRQPVSRRKVLLGALLTLFVLVTVVAVSEWLRPGRGTPFSPITAEHDSDPRLAVECARDPAREGARPAANAGGARAAEVTSADLYDCPTTWDGRRVRLAGEVVGGVLQRGDSAWLQVNDDVYAGELGPLPSHRQLRGGNAGVGVLVPRELIGPIRHVGGPRERGDLVEIVGTYHRVDAETHEVAIVRADELRVIQDGRAITRPVDPMRVVVATLMTLIAAGLVGLDRWIRRRQLRR